MYTVWNPYTAQGIALLESVQNRAARWIKSYWDPSTFQWSKSSSVCIEELRWPSLTEHRNFISILTLYSILHGTTSINFSVQYSCYTITSSDIELSILHYQCLLAFFFCCNTIFVKLGII